MKQSFGSHAHLAHIWASQSYPRGHSGDKRMLFHGGAIYSYGTHFPIAAFLSSGSVLWNYEGHSSSTGKHKSLVAQAMHGLKIRRIYVCMAHMEQIISWARADREEVGAATIPSSEWPAEEKKRLFDEACAYHAKQAATYIGKAKRARTRAGHYSAQAVKQLDIIKALSEFLGYKEESTNFDRLRKQAESEMAASADAAKARVAKQEAARADLREALKDFPSRWRAHETLAISKNEKTGCDSYLVTTRHWEEVDGATLVRRSKDGTTVETSRGANVTWNEALKLYTFAARIRAKGESWTPPSDTKCGPYRLSRIEANGDSLIGCHTLTWDAMNQLAMREGIAI